jgi:alpha-glucoside transport system permease protein
VTLLGIIGTAAAVTVGAPVLVLAWLRGSERAIRRLPQRVQKTVRPWLWAAPALVIVGVFLLWPVLRTVALSVTGPAGTWSGNGYRYLITAPEVRAALVNNAWWLIGLTTTTLVLGMLVALLSNAVRWESVATSVIVMPVAISAVAGAVVWRLVFDYRPLGTPQTGTLNALGRTLLGAEPVAWLVERPLNKVALLVVGVWMSTGIATVVLSAAVKALPPELGEAARLDGAGNWTAFRFVTLPQLAPTLVTVATLLGITALKAFDVIYVMTGGNYDTDVLATLMYRKLFLGTDQGSAAALAVLIVVLTLPIIVANLWVHREEAS